MEFRVQSIVTISTSEGPYRTYKIQ